MKVRILLADDHRIMRDGLKALLEKHASLEVVAEADNGLQTLELARETRPDIVIMDIAMPDLNGIEATRQLKGELPEVRVIALSMHSDRRFVTEVLKAGALAYVLKQSAFEDLVEAIRAVKAGRRFLSGEILDAVVGDYLGQIAGSNYPAFLRLSDRERQVLQLIAEGNTTKEIAFKLHVSVKTVETHRQNLMNKLDIRSLAGLTKFAIREGLTDLEDS
jgi:DNA-binding NarL/FixJ family response regulator